MEIDILTIVATLVVGATLYFIFQRLFSSSAPPPKFTADPASPNSSRSIEEDDDEDKITLNIFYGSQTGTAEDFANTLSDEGTAYGFRCEVIDLEDIQPEEIGESKYAIFCMATYGEGEPTDNARAFFEWIKETEEEEICSDLKFSVFGLGNKTYEHYNYMGKEVDTKLEAMGGQRVYPLGMGDDDASLEEDFDKWKRDLWAPLCAAAGLEASEPRNIKKQRRYEMSIHEPQPGGKVTSHHFQTSYELEKSGDYLSPSEALFAANHKLYKIYDAKNPYLGKVVAHRELLSPESDRSCLHLEVELIKNFYLRYQPGDHIGVFPENENELVEYVAQRLQVDLEQVIKLSPAGKSKATPLGPFTVRRALRSYADLTARPRQSFLREIAQFAEDDEDKARLLRLGDSSTEETVAEYQKYIVKDHRNIVDVLDEFESLSPPLDMFLELAPRLDPRFYSISSAREDNPNIVSITAVVVEVPKKGGKRKVHRGVCTGWFAEMKEKEGQVIMPCFIRKSEFKLPKDPSTPIVMIGPGTGLAPFRGFLQWRKHNQDKDLGPAALFFGCRNSNIDFLYKDEILAAVEEKYLTELHTAFSREQAEKVYVQHRLVENSKNIYENYVQKNAVVYVCGDATQMAKDVAQCFVNMFKEHEGLNDAEAEERLAAMRKSHHYQEDVWHST
mmetsp:Transcript_25362/g.35102  ORF Transcript_25362/g.35102 Transcript_25362/m.35102 type:complete len:673 (+) Transcript_25362:329-2347(+)